MTLLSPSVNVTYPGLRAALGELGNVPNEVRRELRANIADAGRVVLRDAQDEASWSTRIPGAMRMQARTSGHRIGVFIRVDATKAPHARPYEGLSDRRSTFRHPVFGDRDTWVSQEQRPFLAPSAARGRAGLQQAAIDAIQKAARSRGFH